MARRHDTRVRILALAVIVLAALGFRVWGIAWGLHDANISLRPHPDEWVVYWLFQWFDSTHSLNPCPVAPQQCFFDWGSVYIYLAYGAHALLSPVFALLSSGAFGSRADLVFVHDVLAGRFLSAAASTVTVIIVYRFASAAYGFGAGLVAAILVAFSGLLIQLAHFATPDSTTVLLMSSSLFALYLAMERPVLGRWALAGLLIGLSLGTEYHMALLIVPLTCAWLLSGVRDLRGLLVAASSAAVAYVVTNPYTVIELNAFLAASEHTLRIRTVDSQAEYQGRFDAYGPAWLYVIRYPLGYGEGFALTCWLVAGGIWAALRRRKVEVLLLAWIVPYLFLVSWSSAKFMRYSAPLLPPLAILAGGLVLELWRVRRRAIRVAVVAAAGLALAFSGIYDAAYAGLFASPDPRSVATGWLEDHAPQGTPVAFEELPDGVVNLPYYVSAAGYQPCFLQFHARQLDGSAEYVLLDSYSLEEHPRVSEQAVRHFQAALASDPRYTVVERVHYTPTFLGFRFPIDGSPHDWRYLAHDITVYRRTAGGASDPPNCYPNISSAVAALYPR